MNGYLKIKPQNPIFDKGLTGEIKLDLEENREAFLYVPKNYNHQKATPLIVFLHGAGQKVIFCRKFYQIVEDYGVILLATKSQKKTWDIIANKNTNHWGEYGEDIQFLDKVLKYSFENYHIDPNQITLSGFSDGASYALSVGLTNGELFKKIMVYAPGFIKQSADFVGEPKIYIAHGKKDKVLSIDWSQKKIIPYLKNEHYDITFVKHEKGHILDDEIIKHSFKWLYG